MLLRVQGPFSLKFCLICRDISMKLSINLLTISLVAFFFSACGDGSNTTSGGPTKLSNADMEVDSYSQLPSCAEKREGKTAYVADQEQGYVCQGGEWFKSNAVEIYSSENLSFLENTSSTSNSLSVSKRTMTDSLDGVRLVALRGDSAAEVIDKDAEE